MTSWPASNNSYSTKDINSDSKNDKDTDNNNDSNNNSSDNDNINSTNCSAKEILNVGIITSGKYLHKLAPKPAAF